MKIDFREGKKHPIVLKLTVEETWALYSGISIDRGRFDSHEQWLMLCDIDDQLRSILPCRDQ